MVQEIYHYVRYVRRYIGKEHTKLSITNLYHSPYMFDLYLVNQILYAQLRCLVNRKVTSMTWLSHGPSKLDEMQR